MYDYHIKCNQSCNDDSSAGSQAHEIVILYPNDDISFLVSFKCLRLP
jgi:hypothetical protein